MRRKKSILILIKWFKSFFGENAEENEEQNDS